MGKLALVSECLLLAVGEEPASASCQGGGTVSIQLSRKLVEVLGAMPGNMIWALF